MKRPAEEPRPATAPAPEWSAEALRLLRLIEEPDDAQAARVLPFRGREDPPR